MQVRSALQSARAGWLLRSKLWVTVAQDFNEDAEVQRLKQRRQNLMYQVAVLQLQQVRDMRALQTATKVHFRHSLQGKMAAMLQTR